MADSAQLYTTLLASPYTFTLDVLKVYGASEPDIIEKFGVTHDMLDGSLSEQIVGGRRGIKIDFHVMSLLNRRKLVKWWLDPDRIIKSLIAAPTLAAITASAGGALTNDVTYYYKVVAVDVIGHSPASNERSIVIDPAPSTVRTAPLTWNALASARYYKIYRKNADELSNAYGFLDYSLTNSYTDAGAGAEVAQTVPSANASISVISGDLLESAWGHDTELERLYTLDLQEATIFLKADGFESKE